MILIVQAAKLHVTNLVAISIHNCAALWRKNIEQISFGTKEREILLLSLRSLLCVAL